MRRYLRGGAFALFFHPHPREFATQNKKSADARGLARVAGGMGAAGMGLMHNYVIQCMRVRLGGIAKQVPPFFRECVFHFYILATNIPL